MSFYFIIIKYAIMLCINEYNNIKIDVLTLTINNIERGKDARTIKT